MLSGWSATDPTPALAKETVSHYLGVIAIVDRQAAWGTWDEDYVHADCLDSIREGYKASAAFIDAARDTLAGQAKE